MRAMPDWLLEEARYEPKADRDAFVDRSILGFLSVLSRGRRRPGRAGRRPLEPVVKVGAVFAVILLVSLSRSSAFLSMASTGLLVALALQEARIIATVLKTSLAVAAFTILILLPSALWGHGGPAAILALKVFLSAACARLVSATTDWASISGAFKRLGAPDLFILVFDIALKYISLLGEFALAMLYALKLRSVGRNPGKAASLGGVAGTLFLKSKEMAEDMYGAMECRGFTGEYRAAGRFRFGLREGAACLAVALLGAAFFLTRTR